ncbi:MAG: GNAT family N-acetyltransferase [Deltaproteobacteria bacterium]|nr:GNAT family N-acetyltransferase [Deltaproteobacteria bacterium]MBW2445096.1 GNAT family N-acetyltransferase [Deltaproteobacteria bacterium]
MSTHEAGAAFSEKAFYLQEFRGRTLLFAVPSRDLGDASGGLAAVLDELTAHAARCVVIASDAAGLEKLVGSTPLEGGDPGLPGEVWRRLRQRPRVGVVCGDAPLGASVREVAVRLGATKLVILDPAGGWVRPDGSQASFVGLEELGRSAGPRQGLVEDVRALLEAGVPAVNLCSQAGLADELFTYAGSGTLFTRERYVTVRRLGLDDFDAAADLVARGVEEGYLAPRTPEEVDSVLASGFGAFVEGVHLAGIGALVAHAGGRTGEIGSLYTLTRFLGEGVGAHLVAFAMEEAARRGLERVFACTTSERVVAFFERNGFERVASDALPAEKWAAYDRARRARLLCLARAVG